MTTVMAREGRWARGADVPSGVDVPTITANRKRLDRDAPNLAFTIASRKRFVEVVIASDKALFDPANAPQRTPHNFFASRAFGLTHMSGPDATYIVPTAVLRAFLEGQPRPREIFFTVIACDDDEGHGPVLAQPLAQLLVAAPSVPLAADYTVQGLARSFGMALDRLVRHEGTRAQATAFAATNAPPSSVGAAPVASRWEASGTIRVPVAAGQSDDEDSPRVDAETSWSLDADGFDRDEPSAAGSSYGSAYGDDEQETDAGGGVAAAMSDVEYDDGFGVDDDTPVGVEPAELPDDEYATSYGDEADLAPQGASEAMDAAPTNGVPSNGAPTNGALAPSARSQVPTAAQLAAVLARVAATLDGQSLYSMARRSDAGLRFGIGAFDQRSGALGAVLTQMKAADGAAFARMFGDAADQLIAITTASTPQARMADVGGRPLGDPAWAQRFAAAGAHPPFIRAENEALVAGVLAPLWPVAAGLGLTSARAVAVVLVLGIHMGPQEAAVWLTERLAPAHTDAQVGSALAAIGAPDLASFQRQAGLAPSGRIDPETKAALTAALRRLGATSPVPVPTAAQMLDTVRRHAGHGGVAHKLAALMVDAALVDPPR